MRRQPQHASTKKTVAETNNTSSSSMKNSKVYQVSLALVIIGLCVNLVVTRKDVSLLMATSTYTTASLIVHVPVSVNDADDAGPQYMNKSKHYKNNANETGTGSGRIPNKRGDEGSSNTSKTSDVNVNEQAAAADHITAMPQVQAKEVATKEAEVLQDSNDTSDANEQATPADHITITPQAQAKEADTNEAEVTQEPKLTPTTSREKEQEPETSPSPIQEWSQKLQQSSRKALRHMEAQGALISPFSTRESALEKGFPVQWNPCTIHNLLEQKQQQQTQTPLLLKVVVLGGSCSALGARDCADESGDPYDGRYSNIAQKYMGLDLLKFFTDAETNTTSFQVEFLNVAQGSTNSVLSGLTMDTLVDPTDADILIWEYTPNEPWGFQKASPNKFQFWMARIQALFEQADRPVPPILMIFLWERNIGLPRRRDTLLAGLDFSVQSAMPFIEYYKRQQEQHQWSIQAVSVGSTIANLTALADNTTLMLDDEIHPSCYSVHLISDMIRHAIHSNLASCNRNGDDRNILKASSSSSNSNSSSIRDSIVQPQAPPPLPNANNFTDLWDLMINPKARIASFTAWHPQMGKSNLKVANLTSLLQNWTSKNTEKTYPTRADRKIGYFLPMCSDTDNATHPVTVLRPSMTLLEPNLQWIGLGITKKGGIRASINGVEAPLETHVPDIGFQYVDHWVRVSSDVILESTNYTLSFCDSSIGGVYKTWLRQLIGVMAPGLDPR